jgi:hypothetical protein
MRAHCPCDVDCGKDKISTHVTHHYLARTNLKVSVLITLIATLSFVTRLSAASSSVEDPNNAKLQEIAARYPDPNLWDVAIFFPLGKATEFIKVLKNKSITCRIGKNQVLQLTVADADFTSGWGMGIARLNVRISGGTESLGKGAVDIHLKAPLACDGFASDEGGVGRARFHVDLEGTPQTDDFAMRVLVQQLSDSGAFKALSKTLEFSIPVPIDISEKFGFDDDLILRNKNEGWIKLHARVPDSEFRLKVEAFEPIFVPGGVWLCAHFAGSVQPKKANASTATLQQALQRYEERASKNPKIHVNGHFLEGFANDFAKLPVDHRTATVKVNAHGGRLLKVGGDMFVALWPHDYNGTAKLSVTPKTEWRNDGLHLACSYRVSGNAQLHVHVDPGPSGGLGTSVKTAVDSAGTIKALLQIKSITNEKASSVFVFPRFDPDQNLIADFLTNGIAKINVLGGYFNCFVSSVGVRVTLPAPPDVVPPISLVSSKPIPPVPIGGNTICGIVTPLGTNTDSSGFEIEFKTAIVSLTPEERAFLDKEVAALTASFGKFDLKVGKIEGLIGDWAIGPNNTFVKFVVEAVKAPENVRKTLKIAWKDTTRELRTARRNVGREATKSWNDLRREGGAFVRDLHGVASKTGKWIQDHAVPHPHFHIGRNYIKL